MVPLSNSAAAAWACRVLRDSRRQSSSLIPRTGQFENYESLRGLWFCCFVVGGGVLLSTSTSSNPKESVSFETENNRTHTLARRHPLASTRHIYSPSIFSTTVTTRHSMVVWSSLWHHLMRQTRSVTQCDEFEEEYPTGYTETERFHQILEYHQSLLFDYKRRWGGKSTDEKEEEAKEDDESKNSHSPLPTLDVGPSTDWPKNIPSESDIPALELDLKFCLLSPSYRNHGSNCQNLKFRIASYYLTQTKDEALQTKGYKWVKDLAEHGHADGMCLYAILLTDGRVPGVDANPEEAVVWLRRCVDLHRHIAATYELAIAMYTGEGVFENPEFAVKLFRQAANLGHPGAAYMLGECLLDGVGSKRDRASALEWLVTAAELGHQRARERVLVVLQEEHDFEDTKDVELGRRGEEAMKWVGDGHPSIERRHTVGVGNPQISARRKTKVLESRTG